MRSEYLTTIAPIFLSRTPSLVPACVSALTQPHTRHYRSHHRFSTELETLKDVSTPDKFYEWLDVVAFPFFIPAETSSKQRDTYEAYLTRSPGGRELHIETLDGILTLVDRRIQIRQQRMTASHQYVSIESGSVQTSEYDTGWLSILRHRPAQGSVQRAVQLLHSLRQFGRS